MARYPKLQQPELEYRAKLTELALAESADYARTLMMQFKGGSASDRSNPHGYAQYWVSKGMSDAGSLADIHANARALLLESSEKMRAAGPAVERFLP